MSDTSYHKLAQEVPPPPSGCPVDASFSTFSDAYMADPYRELASRRTETPVFYSEKLGLVVLTTMEHISQVFLSPDTFSPENVQDPVFPLDPAAQEVLSAPDFNPMAVMSNRLEPDHGRIRQYTKGGFSNRRMKVLEPYIRRRAHELIDDIMAAGSSADFVPTFAAPLPGDTIFRFIGFPEADDDQLRSWCGERLAFSWGKPTPDQQIDIAEKMLSYWRYCREFTARKHDDLTDDFASELLADHDANPDDLSYREVESIIYGLSFAGHEPVTLLLGNILLCLLQRREEWNAICADPSLIPSAIEEVIRYESPQIGWRRIAVEDTSVGGVDIPKGTRIFMSLGSANHQPSEFDNPTEFDMFRVNSRNNISFGKGNHYCLGAKMARFEARVALEVITQRLPSLRLADEQHLDRIPNVSFRGPTSLIVNWD
ncbi:MAG: cytochrome P450 [Acidimicrobiales bacterium]